MVALMLLLGSIIATTTTTTTATTVATTTASKPVTIPKQACDTNSGETWLVNSPGKNVPTLDLCKEMCAASTECSSLTYWGSKSCDHFSTACKSTEKNDDATAVQFPPENRDPYSWSLVAYGKECDFDKGEEFIPSTSKTRDSLMQCLESCQSQPDCKAIVYYPQSLFCSHVSTACEKTQASPQAISFSLIVATTTTAMTTTTTTATTTTTTTF